jgi:5-methylcytosine-specific restriction endonuclease McrA
MARSRRALFPSSCKGCGRRTEDGAELCTPCAVKRGETHQTEAQRRITQPYREHYASAEYAANRLLELDASGHRCRRCSRKIGQAPHDWECDHRLPLRDGGTDNLSNLDALCLSCARAKTAQDRTARRELGG